GALVDASITDAAVTPVSASSRATIRERTPLGESYLEITPGASPKMLRSGGALPVSQSDNYVDVDQVLSIFQGTTRARARAMIEGLGQGLNGEGTNLNQMLGGAA